MVVFSTEQPASVPVVLISAAKPPTHSVLPETAEFFTWTLVQLPTTFVVPMKPPTTPILEVWLTVAPSKVTSWRSPLSTPVKEA